LLRIDLYSNLGDCISKCYHDISDIVAEDGLNPVLSDDVKKCQQSSKEKRLQEYQITSKAPENSNAFSSPSISDPVESSPCSPEVQTQQMSSPPQPQEEPQVEEL